jgi:hypothetical protein
VLAGLDGAGLPQRDHRADAPGFEQRVERFGVAAPVQHGHLRFLDAHPRAVIERGTWHAAIPESYWTRFTVQRNLGELVDRLAELYGEW